MSLFYVYPLSTSFRTAQTGAHKSLVSFFQDRQQASSLWFKEAVVAETVHSAYLFSSSKMVACIIWIVDRRFLGPHFPRLLENLVGGHGYQERRYF